MQRDEAAGRTNCVCDGILGLVEIAGDCHQLHVQVQYSEPAALHYQLVEGASDQSGLFGSCNRLC